MLMKREAWAKHWQCDSDEELRSLEEDLAKAARSGEERRVVTVFHPRVLVRLSRKTRRDSVKVFEKD